MADLIESDSTQSLEVDFLGLPIEAHEIIDVLRYGIGLKQICQQVLERKVIEQSAQERQIIVSPEQIQVEADRMRHDMHLERTSDTLAWLSGHLLTPEDWETSIRDRLLKEALKELLFSGEVDRFFAQNRLDFEQAILYQIAVPYPQLAQEIYYQIEEAEISFYEAAHLYDLNPKQRYQCGYLGAVHRWELHPDLAVQVFSANPGDIIRPIQIENQYYVLKVEEFVQAELTPETRQTILAKLFEEWLQGEVDYLLHQ
jgi:hypothetical protein